MSSYQENGTLERWNNNNEECGRQTDAHMQPQLPTEIK